MSPTVYSSAEERRVSRALPELFRARELLWDLVVKDLRVRYRYAAVGFLWAVLEPLALMLVLVFVFQYLFGAKTAPLREGVAAPYPLVVLSGIVFWQYFANSLTTATGSLVAHQHLLTKVRFAREVIPLAAIGQALFMLAIAVVLLLGIGTVYGLRPALPWLAVLPLVAIQTTWVAGLALLLSAGHVHYRDIGHMVGVAMGLGFYATPVFYPASLVLESDQLPALLKTLYFANPMAGLLAGYRSALLEGAWPALALLVWPALGGVLMLLAGGWVFRRAAPNFADHL